MGTLTLAHTKGVGILVSNPRTGRLFKVEVKTTLKRPSRSAILGFNYEWMLNEKAERLTDPSLVYCFVLIRGSDPPAAVLPRAEQCRRDVRP